MNQDYYDVNEVNRITDEQGGEEMDKQEDKLIEIFRELSKEGRDKLLAVGEVMIALNNLSLKPSQPKTMA